MSTYTFTYSVNTGRTQSFRCLAADETEAVRYWAEERALWRKITGGPVVAVKVEVA